jgi:ribonuclease P/MRP protein subunit RPP1
MKFYDLHISPNENLEKTFELAKKLGWSGIGLIFDYKGEEDLENIKNSVKSLKSEGIDLVFGVKIKTSKPFYVRKIASSIRKKVELILVQGGDLEVNRAALETPEVDILTNPGFGREDSGFNYVLANLAAKNNVAIEFGFRDLLYSYKKTRAGIFSNLIENAKLVRKYKAPFVITSDALSFWDLRSPSEFISFGKLLGFQPSEIKTAISDKIVKDNRKRSGGCWVRPGVEIEK